MIVASGDAILAWDRAQRAKTQERYRREELENTAQLWREAAAAFKMCGNLTRMNEALANAKAIETQLKDG